MYEISIYYRSKTGSYLNFEVVPENFEIIGRGIELKTDVRDCIIESPTVEGLTVLIEFLNQKVRDDIIFSDYKVIITRKY